MMRGVSTALLIGGVCAFAAQAAEYPERPVRVIVTFPAGGGTDIVARMVIQKLAERTGGSFVVDNRGEIGRAHV